MSALLLFAPLLALAQVEATKCGADVDCPNGAICEKGVCTVMNPNALETPVPPTVPADPKPDGTQFQTPQAPKTKFKTYPDGTQSCRRNQHCAEGQTCFRRRCGPRPPSNGLGLRIAGWITSGLGLAWGGVATLFGIAAAEVGGSIGEDFARGYAIIFGVGSGLALASGIPMLIVGYVRRGKFTRWMKKHHPNLAVVPTKDSGAVAFSLRF